MFKNKKKYGIMIIGDNMASRIERYYKTDDSSKKRSQLNKKLYDSIYEESEYSNIEAIATMSKPDEIDITKIKELLKNREDYKKQKQYRQIVKEEERKEMPEYKIQAEEVKNYDVKELLDKAKDTAVDKKYRRLDNTNYNILKELKIHKEQGTKEEKDNLKEMIDTISHTSKLHKLDNQELGLDLLSDLKGSEETVIQTNDTIRSLIEEAKKEEGNKQEASTEIDKSFYTTGMNFGKKDFVDFEDLKENSFFQSNLFKAIIIVLLLVAVVIGIIVFVLK